MRPYKRGIKDLTCLALVIPGTRVGYIKLSRRTESRQAWMYFTLPFSFLAISYNYYIFVNVYIILPYLLLLILE